MYNRQVIFIKIQRKKLFAKCSQLKREKFNKLITNNKLITVKFYDFCNSCRILEKRHMTSKAFK